MILAKTVPMDFSYHASFEFKAKLMVRKKKKMRQVLLVTTPILWAVRKGNGVTWGRRMANGRTVI